MAHEDQPIPVFSSLDPVYGDGSLEEAQVRFQTINNKFAELFGGDQPDLFARSPGRVNLIGEHIDYEGYSVLPMAIRQDTIIAIKKRSKSDTLRIGNVNNKYSMCTYPVDPSQALAKIATKFGEKMRNASDIWAPPIYRRLVSNDRKERDMTERCMLKLKSVIYPPLPNLSKVAALDIKKNLLSNMLVMVDDCQKIVPMIRAWGWYISLIGPDSVKHRGIINQMLKIPEQTC